MDGTGEGVGVGSGVGSGVGVGVGVGLGVGGGVPSTRTVTTNRPELVPSETGPRSAVASLLATTIL
jgi:hypothetical protein